MTVATIGMGRNYMREAYAPAEAEYRRKVLIETYGHLGPGRNKRYKGSMVFALGAWGDYIPLSAEFADLEDSPWFFESMLGFITDNAPEPAIYRFTGYWCNYRFVGDITRLIDC